MQRYGAEKEGAARKQLWRFLPLACVLLALGCGYAFGLHRYLSLGNIARYQSELARFVAEHGILAAAAYLLIYVGAVGLSFPGASVLTAAGGFMFGAGLGTLLAATAATIGAAIIFLAARTSLGDLLAERAGPRLQRLRQSFGNNALSWLLFLRLAPVFPFWLVNLAAALFGMRLGPYVLGTAVGILPGTFALAYLGQNLDSALDGKGPILSAGLLGALALLAVLSLLPVVLRRYRRGPAVTGSRK